MRLVKMKVNPGKLTLLSLEILELSTYSGGVRVEGFLGKFMKCHSKKGCITPRTPLEIFFLKKNEIGKGFRVLFVELEGEKLGIIS